MGKFQKGQSGNPAGRPVGSRHRSTLIAKTLIDGQAKELTQKAVDMAMSGDPVALKLCLERIYPRPKEASITAPLPKISGPGDVPNAISEILALVGSGQLTIDDGKGVVNIIAAHMNAFALADLAARIAALEGASAK